MRILIAGDFSLSAQADNFLKESGNFRNNFSEITQIIKDSDYSIVNLESPITESNTPIIKDGPCLKNTTTALHCLKDMGFRGVTLANNHLKDYGEDGVSDTLKNCVEYGFDIVGAGENINKARLPLILDSDIAILNVCESEFSIAQEDSVGAAPLDLINIFEDITKIKSLGKRIIVVVHGGSEHYPYPTPRMQKTYRHLIKLGAEIVVNHHQHCFSGYEPYEKGLIFYGLGNFYFHNPSKWNSKWNEGLLLELEMSSGKETNFRIIPIEQCNGNLSVKLHPCASAIEKTIQEINATIQSEDQLKEKYLEFIKKKRPLGPFFPIDFHYIKALYNRGILPSLLSKSKKAHILNTIRCESHRDVVVEYLNQVEKL